MKKILVIFLLFAPLFYSQSLPSPDNIKLPDGLKVYNHFEYSFDVEDENEILENWLNIDYRYGAFTTGIRFEHFQPNDPNPSISRGKTRFSEIDFKYLKFDLGNKREGLSITAGNYYALFGRGMVLKSYEDRNVRVDNNLLGVKFEARYKKFVLTALSGMPASDQNERKDVLHAADLMYKGFKKFKLGASFASSDPESENEARTRLAAFRIMPSIWNFDFYAEYGMKFNDDINEEYFNNDEPYIGKALYGSMNFYYGKFSMAAEYKLYDNFAFESGDKSVAYNNLPAVRRNYAYFLLNRHPSPLNQNNETGFQVEAWYTLSDETSFNASYSQTETLDDNSLYQKIRGASLDTRTQFKEAFGQISHTWNKKLTTTAAFGYTEEASSSTKSITPIIENKYYIDDINSLKLIVEHQHVDNSFTGEKYFDDVITFEYARAPRLSVAFVSEMLTKEPEEGETKRIFWNFVQFGYKFGQHTDIYLLLGSRQAGNICIGGVCRYEPEFRGIELKMHTRL